MDNQTSPTMTKTKRTPHKDASAKAVPQNTEQSSDSSKFEGFSDWELAADVTTQRELSSLFRQREQVHQKIVRVDKSLTAMQHQNSLAQLRTFSKNIDSAYTEFSNFHSRVIAIVPDAAFDEQEAVYNRFEELYNHCSTTIEELILEQNQTPAVPQQNASQPRIIVQQQAMRAPLPTFDGQYRNWPRFRTMFQDLMQNSADSDAVKLYHLERSLVGEARNVIDVATIRDNNYQHAWRILEERFDNKRLIVDTHIQGIRDLKKMTRKSSRELRDLLDECTRHVEGLRFMEQELSGVSELFVVNILTSVLDPESRESWERSLKKCELPRYQTTIDFLQNWCLVLERCESSVQQSAITKSISAPEIFCIIERCIQGVKYSNILIKCYL